MAAHELPEDFEADGEPHREVLYVQDDQEGPEPREGAGGEEPLRVHGRPHESAVVPAHQQEVLEELLVCEERPR